MTTLLVSLLLVACGNEDSATSDDSARGGSGGSIPANAAPPEDLPLDGPVDVPVDLSELPVRAPSPDEPPVERPRIQGLATNQGIVELGITNDNTVGFVGQAPSRGSVELSLDGEFIGSAMGRSDGTWVFDYQAVPLSEGPHELDATGVMPDGKRMEAEETFSFAYVPDAMPAPVIMGLQPDTGSDNADGITHAAEIELLGTATPNLPVVIYQDGSVAGSADTDANGDWVFDYTGTTLADNTYQFSAVTEYESETSAASAVYTVRVDTGVSSPTVNILNDSSGGNGVSNNPGVVIGGTTEPGGSVEVNRDGTVIDTVVADGNGDWQVTDDDSPLADGDYNYSAVVTDPAGNVSNASAPVSLQVDTVAPAAPVVSGVLDDTGSDSGDGITSQNAVRISGQAEADSTVAVLVDGSVEGTAVADGSGSWTLDYTDTPLAEGSYVITATATDLAGNTSAASSPFNLTVNLSVAAPVIDGISDDTGIAGDGLTSDPELLVNGTAEAGAVVEIRRDGSLIGTVTADNNGVWELDYTGTVLGDGSYQFTAVATDLAGNTSGVSSPYSVTIDASTAAPEITGFSDDTSTDGDGVTSDNTLVFSGTAESGATVEVSVDGVPQAPVLTADGAGDWSWDNTGSPLAEGTYSVTATATNQAGAVSAPSATLTVTVDQSAPVVDALSPANGANNASLDDSLSITFDERVFVSGGQITIFRLSDDAVLEQIPLPDARVSGDGTDTLTVDANASLVGGTEYYVQVDASGLRDRAGNSYAGIADTTSWRFTAEPTGIELMVPDNGATGVSPNSDLSIRFNEPVQLGTGDIRVRAASDDTVFETLSMTDPAVTLIGANVVSFDIPVLDAGTEYYVELDAGAVENSGGVAYAGFTGNATWSFTTATGSVATVTGVSSPVADGTYATGATVPVEVTFSELVDVTDGIPTLELQLDDGTRTVSYVSGSGSNVLTFEYTVLYGDKSSDLAYASNSSLSLNGSRIRSASFEDSDLSLPLPGTGGSLSANKDIVISGDSVSADDPGDAGYVMPGNQAGGTLGSAISAVGDVNGDGFEDFAVAAPGLDNGVVYVIWGKDNATPEDIALQPDGSIDAVDGFRILGSAAGDELGISVGGAGDFNRDGYDDLLVGAPGSDAGGTDAGAVYVVWGQAGATRSDLDLSALNHAVGNADAAAMVILGAESGQRLGAGVAAPDNGQVLALGQDFNGDGIHDLAVGHPGSDLEGPDAGMVYLVFGRTGASRANLSLSSLGSEGVLVSPGANAGWQLGQGLRFAGDFNGDGYDDLLVGAAGNSDLATDAGAAYLVFGSELPSDLSLDTMAGSEGFMLTTATAGASLGYSVASGDFNGDGRSDIAVGAPGNDSVYVLYGYDADSFSDRNLDTLLAAQGYRIVSGDVGDVFGHAISSAGDFDADGIDDLLVGAYLSNRSGEDAGSAWMIKGSLDDRASWNLSSAAESSYVSIVGGGAGDLLGSSVGAGDLNGDGFTDLLLGAPGGDLGGSSGGQVLVINGGGYGTTHSDGLSGTASDELILGTSGDDTLSGGGGSDVFSTGAGSDIISVPDVGFRKLSAGRGNLLTGMDVLQLSGVGQSLDLTVLEPGRINGVEMLDLGSGGNALNVSPLSLLALSRETNQLYVVGDGSDTVTVEATDFWEDHGSETVGSDTYNKYVSGGAELFIDQLVNQSSISAFAGSQRYNLNTTSGGANVASDIPDFPVLVRINDAGIIDATESDARDIRVVGPDGSYLDYEVERWDQDSNVAELWVRMPTVYGNTDGANSADQNFFTLLYGAGPGVPDAQSTGVWDAYSGVWHLAEGSGAVASDSSANGNDSTSGSGSSWSGPVGRGRYFSGAGMTVATNATLDVASGTPLTVSAWVDQSSGYGSWNSSKDVIMSQGASGAFWSYETYNENFIGQVQPELWRLSAGSGTTEVERSSSWGGWGDTDYTGPLQLFTLVFDGATARMYINGQQVASSGASLQVNGRDLLFGAFDGGMDELRYGKFTMSADEVELMYQNQRPFGQSLVAPAP